MSFDLLSALTSLPLFRDVRPDAIKRFVADTRAVILRPGDTLFREGELADDGAVLIVTGKLVATIGQGTALRVLGEVRAGEVVGELALFTPSKPRSATLAADGPVRGLRFTMKTLEDQADNPAVCALEQQLAMGVARRIRRTTAGLRKVSREKAPPTVRTLRERISSWLGFSDD